MVCVCWYFVFLDNCVRSRQLAFLSKWKKLAYENDPPISIPVNSPCFCFSYKLASLLRKFADWYSARLVV